MEQAAASMRRPTDVGETLRALTVGAVDAIDGADLASITTRHRDGRLETVAATDPLVEGLDARQYELQEGPCYETATDETFTVSFDMAHDGRWPRYGPVAAEAGVHAQLGIALASDDDGSRSALNVYAPGSGVSVGSSGCQGPNVPRDSISPCGTGFVSVAW